MTPLQRVMRDAPAHGIWDSRLHLFGQCATGELGAHLRCCDHCGVRDAVPNACRSRSCPFCRSAERAAWVQQQESLLPAVPYFHAVFTVPQELRRFGRADATTFHRILFDAARESLLRICGDPKHLGVSPVALAVQHTWKQDLNYHPHVHVLVSAGGLTPEGEWRYSGETRKRGFLVPVKVLRAHYRTVLIRHLVRAFKAGYFQNLFLNAATLARFLGAVAFGKKNWNIDLKRPLSGPAAVVRYFARYVNRVAIAPSRVTNYDGDNVRFTWEDRAHGCIQRTAELPAAQFLRRFRQHLPAKGFVRIRSWGLLAHRVRKAMLARVIEALKDAVLPKNLPVVTLPTPEKTAESAVSSRMRCPHCKIGHFIYVPPHERTADDLSLIHI